MQQSCTHFGVVTGNPNMVMALAGNKTDLEDKRKVTTEVSTVIVIYFLVFVGTLWYALLFVWLKYTFRF